ncbi:hypothetical protein H696_01335 [Fonticula alba]|uniref:3'-5' exonuclease domain-containing protein n=1 Tax=Fonticula alba TaxID=691883 RepID=A0A058ZBX2_FONAL|nr:hypothetical protein H696_01335 [Fonticula alba]KCV71925.1 hypothetical protein H696_01335 [Fonticula alba]|eukprot:XP_009493503.1 hypothetical protein H696_01335 [Fonticula alba]
MVLDFMNKGTVPVESDLNAFFGGYDQHSRFDRANMLALAAVVVSFGVLAENPAWELGARLMALDKELEMPFDRHMAKYKVSGILDDELDMVIRDALAIEPFMPFFVGASYFVRCCIPLLGLMNDYWDIEKMKKKLQRDSFSLTVWSQSYKPLRSVGWRPVAFTNLASINLLHYAIRQVGIEPHPVAATAGPEYPMYERPAGVQVVWVDTPAAAEAFCAMLHRQGGISALDTESIPNAQSKVPALVQVCLTPLPAEALGRLTWHGVAAALRRSVVFLFSMAKHPDLATACLREYLTVHDQHRSWVNLVYNYSSDVVPLASYLQMPGDMPSFIDLADHPTQPSDNKKPSTQHRPSLGGYPADIPPEYAGHMHTVPAPLRDWGHPFPGISDSKGLKGLKGMVAFCFGVLLDSSWTMADWSLWKEDMHPAQVDYAVNDAVVLVELFLRYRAAYQQKHLADGQRNRPTREQQDRRPGAPASGQHGGGQRAGRDNASGRGGHRRPQPAAGQRSPQ